MRIHGSDVVIVDDAIPAPRREADRQHPGPSSPVGTLVGAAAVEVQLQRLQVRMVAEAGGDPALERVVSSYLAESCARFATARVRQFVPILVEREVRARLRAEGRAADSERTA